MARAAQIEGAAERWADDDLLVLLTEDGHAAGVAGKRETHHASTPLHLAFSCYVFDSDDRVLVTRRSAQKLVFPGERTNSCCGHPQPGEALGAAIVRRLASELGLSVERGAVRLVLPGFRYRAQSQGIWEHELCPVHVVVVPPGALVRPDPQEVDEAWWEPWSDYVERALHDPGSLSPWSVAQVHDLLRLGPTPRDWPTAPAHDLPPAAQVVA